MNIPLMPNLQPVEKEALIDFHCVRCGACCKHIRQSVMLSSYDVFMLAKFFKSAVGADNAISHVCENYAEIVMLTEHYPILTLRTKGEDDVCIFLSDNRCSVCAARPRICRLYPLAAEPEFGDAMFQYHLCTDQPHHFKDGKICVKEWVRKNFRSKEQTLVLQELRHAASIHRALKDIPNEGMPRMLTMMLYYLYFDFDLHEPFFEQYERNNAKLMALLKHNR